MASLPVPFDPYNPIPNNPFYSPASFFLAGPLGPVIVGSGLSVSTLGVISSTGGGSGGTVTSVAAGTGLTGGVITTTGTIGLANTGVTPGTYSFATVVVDATGRITGAANGSAVTGVNVNFPLLTSGSSTFPTLSVNQASTSQVGVTQLNNTTSSTLTNQALTAAAGYNLQQQINALAQGVSGLILAGTLNATTGNVVNPPTTAGAAAGFTGGSPVPAATTALNNYYLIVTTAAASYTPTGGSAILNVNVGDYILVASGAWAILRVGPITGAYATTTTAGVVELATVIEVQTGTDPNTVVTPFTGSSNYVMNKCFTAPGQILASSGSGTYSALATGTDSYVLTADSSCSTGVKWAAASGGGGATVNVTFNSPLSSTTNPYTGGVAGVSIAAATTSACGAVQLADTSATQAGVSTSLAITPAGAAATYFPICDYTTKGQIAVATGAGTFSIVAAGPNGCVLTACSGCTEGLFWGSNIPAAATPTTRGTVYGIGEPGAGQNMSVGSSALTSITTGNANTALGIGAMALSTSACCNVAVGICALYNELTGCQNVAIGVGALDTSNGGFGNTAVGQTALCSVTTGCRNTAVGWLAGDLISTGYYNSLFGENSGNALTTGVSNVAVGSNSLPLATTGCSNIAIGDNSGANLTTGNCNVLIGPYVCAPVAGGDCQLAIGFGATEWLTGCSTGAIRPGAGIMDCAGSTGTAGQILCSNGSNAIVWAAPSFGAYCAGTVAAGQCLVYCGLQFWLPAAGNNSLQIALASGGANSSYLTTSYVGGVAPGSISSSSCALTTTPQYFAAALGFSGIGIQDGTIKVASGGPAESVGTFNFCGFYSSTSSPYNIDLCVQKTM